MAVVDGWYTNRLFSFHFLYILAEKSSWILSIGSRIQKANDLLWILGPLVLISIRDSFIRSGHILMNPRPLLTLRPQVPGSSHQSVALELGSWNLWTYSRNSQTGHVMTSSGLSCPRLFFTTSAPVLEREKRCWWKVERCRSLRSHARPRAPVPNWKDDR